MEPSLNIFSLDVETTTFKKGDPFANCNSLVLGAIGTSKLYHPFNPGNCRFVQRSLDHAKLVVLFNAKFDLHWCRRVGLHFGVRLPIWDCQLAEFILSNQQWRFPSLDEACAKRNLPRKLDVIKGEFWERTCSCHVSIVERLQKTLERDYANLVTADIITGHDLLELKKSGNGEKLIRSSMRLLNSVVLRNYEQILKQRLEHIEHITNDSTDYRMLSTILVWLKQTVEYVEKWKNLSALTMTTQREAFEICCVDHVMHLLVILRDLNGWQQHSPMCRNTPVDTPDIPHEILSEYLQGDINSTYLLYLAQVEEFKKPEHAGKYKLFRLCCYDLMVLQEMEYNGFLFACDAAKEESIRLERESAAFDAIIQKEFPDVPINLGSPSHISCMLYGGEIVGTTRIPIGVYKTGSRTGQPRYQVVEQTYQLERLVEPLKGSALAKEGYYGTNEDILKSLKGSAKVSRIIAALLDRRGIEKLRGTYYDGIPKLIEEHAWTNSTVHGQFNQCVTITGRLSSTKPNQQNLPGGCKKFCISRYT